MELGMILTTFCFLTVLSASCEVSLCCPYKNNNKMSIISKLQLLGSFLSKATY